MKQKEINELKTIVVKKERLFQISIAFKTICYIALTFIGIVFIWYILDKKYIELYLHQEKDEKVSLLFSVLVSMTLLMFMLSCGFQITYSNILLKIFLIGLILYILYYGFYNYGLGIIINKNFGLLEYKIYESNSKKGIMFFARNWLFWSFVYVISIMFMSEGNE